MDILTGIALVFNFKHPFRMGSGVISIFTWSNGLLILTKYSSSLKIFYQSNAINSSEKQHKNSKIFALI